LAKVPNHVEQPPAAEFAWLDQQKSPPRHAQEFVERKRGMGKVVERFLAQNEVNRSIWKIDRLGIECPQFDARKVA